MCSLSRYLLVGGAAGLLLSTLTGSDVLGWVAAGLAVTAWILAERRFPERFAPATCPVPTGKVDSAPTVRTTTPAPDNDRGPVSPAGSAPPPAPR